MYHKYMFWQYNLKQHRVAFVQSGESPVHAKECDMLRIFIETAVILSFQSEKVAYCSYISRTVKVGGTAAYIHSLKQMWLIYVT